MDEVGEQRVKRAALDAKRHKAAHVEEQAGGQGALREPAEDDGVLDLAAVGLKRGGANSSWIDGERARGAREAP